MSADITPTEGLPLPTEQCRVPRPGDPSMRCVRFKAHTGDHGYAGIFWRSTPVAAPDQPTVQEKQEALALGRIRHLVTRLERDGHITSAMAEGLRAELGGKPSDTPALDSNLVRHARYELERAGFFDADSDYEGMLGESVMQIVRTHAAQGHSGASHYLSLDLATTLFQFKPLTPLTDDPTEWVEVGDGLWQNRRDSEAFSRDGGKTYDLLSERRRWVRTIAPWPVYKHLPRWGKHRVRRSERSAS